MGLITCRVLYTYYMLSNAIRAGNIMSLLLKMVEIGAILIKLIILVRLYT